MKHCVAASFACIALGTAIAAAAPLDGPRAESPPAIRAWEFIERVVGTGLTEFLRGGSVPPSPEFRATALSALPKEGDLVPTRAESVKLAALEPLLAFHGRLGLIDVKVVDAGYAFAGIHAGVVLLLTREALTLVNARELQAIAAHELAHEYFRHEYGAALEARDHIRLQEIELRCDGLAVMTLRELGLDPLHLVRAAAKFTRHNQRLGVATDTRRQVSLKDRLAFIRRVDARLAGTCRCVRP